VSGVVSCRFGRSRRILALGACCSSFTMSNLSNNGSDDEGSRRNEWEAVSLSLSSHSLSVSMTSLYTCTGQGMGGDTFATTALNWEYSLCSLKPPWKKPEIRAHLTVRISPGSWN
jgi:hypothetical protein